MPKFLIIQTASIGDVILATSVLEKLHEFYPDAQIDILVKKGIDSLFIGHPFLKNIYSWDKKNGKIKNLRSILKKVKSEKYDYVINIQRFGLTGLLTALSRAKEKIGFDKNPFSRLFTKQIKHIIGEGGMHEIDRNHELIKAITDNIPGKVSLYPTVGDLNAIKKYSTEKYITIAPASLWFTKQFPASKWVEFLNDVDDDFKVYLLGAKNDIEICKRIVKRSTHKNCLILAGELSLLQTAALMKDAVMNYVNDSAPQHLASAMNASISTIYCSTVPEFGFGPLSDDAVIIESDKILDCRPCGLHGHRECPEKHFDCALTISKQKLVDRLNNGEGNQ